MVILFVSEKENSEMQEDEVGSKVDNRIHLENCVILILRGQMNLQ